MAAEKMQIYSSSSSSSGRQVTPFWKDKYERDAKKYWDIFYRRHKDKFFKDRHYLDKEWGRYFQAREDGEQLVVLEVGCGAGNTIFPLASTYPDIFVHACDFSPRAIDLVKANKDFKGDKINAFVCDLTTHNLSDMISQSSVDIVTLVFMLSAVAPEKMPSVLQNVRDVLKPKGCVLLRDYAIGDLAQERLTSKDQQIGENFYVRGDGTRAYYFSASFLTNLFTENGFDVEEIQIFNKQVENRSLELVMNRCWIQAVFSAKPFEAQKDQLNHAIPEKDDHRLDIDQSAKGPDDDMSETIIEMFDTSPSFDEVIEINPRGYNFRIKALPKEHQHTCKSTGLMLWESARFMCNVLAENPSIVSGKSVLELGCGSSGVCSMVALHHAELVVSTDGDTESLTLLRENVTSNLDPGLTGKPSIMRLIWGDKVDINAVKDLYGSFEVIIGTDVMYNPEAVDPLFETAMELISKRGDGALILCHIQRRVDEDLILASASRFGFGLVDRWVNGLSPRGGMLDSWVSQGDFCGGAFSSTPLMILYFKA